MDKKLTLSLSESVIAKAKDYAKTNNTSLSRMIENYLSAVVEETTFKTEGGSFTPLVERLIGIVEVSAEQEKLYRAAYRDYLSDKYE